MKKVAIDWKFLFQNLDKALAITHDGRIGEKFRLLSETAEGVPIQVEIWFLGSSRWQLFDVSEQCQVAFPRSGYKGIIEHMLVEDSVASTLIDKKPYLKIVSTNRKVLSAVA